MDLTYCMPQDTQRDKTHLLLRLKDKCGLMGEVILGTPLASVVVAAML